MEKPLYRGFDRNAFSFLSINNFLYRFYVINYINLLDLFISKLGLSYFPSRFEELNPIMLYLFDNNLEFIKIIVIVVGTFFYFYLLNKYNYAYLRFKTFHDFVYYFSIFLYLSVIMWNLSLILGLWN